MTSPVNTPASPATSTPGTPAATNTNTTSTAGPAPLPVDDRTTPAISIQFGTGNDVVSYSTSLYKKDYAILVSDSAGNPIQGATITVSVWPMVYRKGTYRWEQLGAGIDEGIWILNTPVFNCPNEDANRNGTLEASEDVNSNRMLDPGVPITVNNSGTTDSAGIANISLIYPKDRSNWTDVELTIRGTVAGSESVSRNVFSLPALSEDFTKRRVTPPGFPSPYGTGDCNVAR